MENEEKQNNEGKIENEQNKINQEEIKYEKTNENNVDNKVVDKVESSNDTNNKKQKTDKNEKNAKKYNKSTITITILVIIIIVMAIAFGIVIVNRDEIFGESTSPTSKSNIDIDNNEETDEEASSNSTSKATPQELFEKLTKAGFSFSISIHDNEGHVFAYGSDTNNEITLHLTINSNNPSSNLLSFRDSSIDEEGEYTYAYLKNGESSSSNSAKQQGLAEKWLKSNGISKDQLEKALEYAYQNKISIAYHTYFKDDENSNEFSIVLNQTSITLPYKGISSTETDVGYSLIPYLEDEAQKENLQNELIKVFVKSYTGGKLSVQEDKKIDLNKQGEYPITFIVTAENGNTKKTTAKVIVSNLSKVDILLDKENIEITKGTKINLMDGVTYSSNLPKKDQGHIETTGSIDIDKVGTYTITYTYIPKDGTNELTTGPKTRTYTVVDVKETELFIKEYSKYILNSSELIGELVFENHSFTLRRRLSKFRRSLF